MKPRTAIIILTILYLVTVIIFCFFYFYKRTPSVKNNQNWQQQITTFDQLTPEEKITTALKNMQANNHYGRYPKSLTLFPCVPKIRTYEKKRLRSLRRSRSKSSKG